LTENDLTNQKNLEGVVEEAQPIVETPVDNPVNEPAPPDAAGEISNETAAQATETDVATATPVEKDANTGVFSTDTNFDSSPVFDNGPHDDFDWEIDKRENTFA